MEDRTYKALEVARMLRIDKDRLLEFEREGRIPPPARDEQGNRVYTSVDVERLRQIVGVKSLPGSSSTVVAVFNMKGGVGKSTVAANLAWIIAQGGYRTLAIDADPQGHMTTSFGREPSDFKLTVQQLLVPGADRQIVPVSEILSEVTPNLHLVPANLSMCSMNLMLFQQPEREYRLRRGLEDIRRQRIYDLVVIDSPPSYDLTSLNILLACDMLIAPVKLDGNSFYGLQYLFDTIGDLQRTYRYEIPVISVVANHYNHSFSVSRQIMSGLHEHYGPYLAQTVIRQDVNFDKANALRQPISVLAPSCKGSRDMASLAREIMAVVMASGHSREDLSS